MGCAASQGNNSQQKGANHGTYGWRLGYSPCRYPIMNHNEPYFNSKNLPTKIQDFRLRMRAVYQFEEMSQKTGRQVQDLINDPSVNTRATNYLSWEWYQWFRSKVPYKQYTNSTPTNEFPTQQPTSDFNGNPYDPRLFLERQMQIIDAYSCSINRNWDIEAVLNELQHLPGQVSIEYFRWYKNTPNKK